MYKNQYTMIPIILINVDEFSDIVENLEFYEIPTTLYLQGDEAIRNQFLQIIKTYINDPDEMYYWRRLENVPDNIFLQYKIKRISVPNKNIITLHKYEQFP